MPMLNVTTSSPDQRQEHARQHDIKVGEPQKPFGRTELRTDEIKRQRQDDSRQHRSADSLDRNATVTVVAGLPKS